MKGDFSTLHFDPREHERGVAAPADGLLRNISGVLHQQGRVMNDADLTEAELLDLGWAGQAGRDIIGAGVCAVPEAAPDGFRVESAAISGSDVHVAVRPGRAWADGVLTRLAGTAANPSAPVARVATYFGPPISDPRPGPDTIADDVRDAVVLELSEEPIHGFQYPERLIEPALGGPDTAERCFVNVRFRLLRLAEGEDCRTILGRLEDDPSTKGRLRASLAPVTAVGGDCPVVAGGGYSGFEHHLYRIEIADTNADAPTRFKWSQWNGGLTGRGRFDATKNPPRVTIDAGRTAIVSSGQTGFYLEALQYDELAGTWNVVYGTIATLNIGHELELASPPTFGALPSTTASVFFRLWNGIEDIAGFTNPVNQGELPDGIRLVFDGPTAGNYEPGDYWTFTLRAGEIGNPQTLIDGEPPTGIVYHRVPLAEITWSRQQSGTLTGTIEDCRQRFRPLTNQRVCCTYLIGDGVSSVGDFNSLEEAAAHLPAGGGELCLLPGVHRANLLLDGRHDVRIHGCPRRSLLLPRTAQRSEPLLRFVDCTGIEVEDLDLVTYDGIAVSVEGRRDGTCSDVHIRRTRIIARTNAIRATRAAQIEIADNRIHLLDTADGHATISIGADDVLIARNAVVSLPFAAQASGEPDAPLDPADPRANTELLYQSPDLVRRQSTQAWAIDPAILAARQPYRAIGGIHLRAGSTRVRVVDNAIVGGSGDGIALGGDLEAVEGPARPDAPLPTPSHAPLPGGGPTGGLGGIPVTAAGRGAVGPAAAPEQVTIKVTSNGLFLGLVQDEGGRPVPGVDVYLESESTATDRSDAQGLVGIKCLPGTYALDVSPSYRVLRVAEARDEGVLVTVVTVAERAVPPTTRGFVQDVRIEGNDISMMGLSGIGFALRAGTSLATASPVIPPGDPKGALLAHVDAAVLNLALAPLLRATDPVRELSIRNNRIHHNLQNPFTNLQLAEAQVIGRGGVSLATAESVDITGNHIYENGLSAVDPICGAFVGYVNGLDIRDNVLAANGAIGVDYEQNRRAGVRGGVFVRFAAALMTQSSSSAGRQPALRLQTNRIDQTAGRALTVYAFGPASIVNNYFNSEHTGQLGFLDAAVGAVAVFNLGGVQRMIQRRAGPVIGDATFKSASNRALPGGETMFADNDIRLGQGSRSLTSQLLVCFDDLAYDSNTASALQADPFLANAVLLADTVRAIASRFQEDATDTISVLTQAARLNMTSLNQADHCGVVRPPAAPPLFEPTVAVPNQVLDASLCAAKTTAEGLGQHIVTTLAAHAGELGGAPAADVFTAVELASLSRQYTAQALSAVNATHTAATKAYQLEAARVSATLGADHPIATALRAQADAGAETIRLLGITAETATIDPPVATASTATLSGRLVNTKAQGQPGYTVELLRSNGTRVAVVGDTDATGYFSASYERARTVALAREGDLFLRVVDVEGKEVFRSREAIRVRPGATIATTCTVPMHVVPRSVIVGGTVIFGEPRPPRVRTPLDVLDIDRDTRAALEAAGIRDVEAVLEVTAATLARVVGDRALATELRAMAKRALAEPPKSASRSTSRPGPKKPPRR